jgi:hypothetical protein
LFYHEDAKDTKFYVIIFHADLADKADTKPNKGFMQIYNNSNPLNLLNLQNLRETIITKFILHADFADKADKVTE